MEDELIYNEVPKSELENGQDLLENIAKQLSFLNDKFKVYENLTVGTVNIETSNGAQELMLSQLREEYYQSQKNYDLKLKEKDLIIDNLRSELDMIKCERNESINQMQNIFKGADGGKNKFAIFNMRKAGGVLHSHQNSVTSMSSMSTTHDDNKIFEKLNSEKIMIEKLLVEYKYKYAETSSKLNELEGEFEKLHKKCNEFAEKIKFKDSLIKKISEERDHYKLNINAHYSVNSCEYLPPQINNKKIETVQLKRSENMQIMEDYIYTEPFKEIKPEINSQPNSKSGSIIKYFKNIFKSGNK